MKGIIEFNQQKNKHELKAGTKVIARSRKVEHLQYLVKSQKHPLVKKFRITEVEVLKVNGPTALDPAGTQVDPKKPDFTINERFDFLEQLIGMVVNKTAKSVVISGYGGIGKTYTVLQCLKKAGKVDYQSTVPSIEDLRPNMIEPGDEEDEIEEKVIAQMSRSHGDYVVVKGYSSAAALYRILFEHQDRTIVFDDCDSVLKNEASLQLLKGALDSYEERWISWRVERSVGETDLPTCFKFKGSIIFVSNMPLERIDEAVRTRTFKIDLTMTVDQRLERMRGVLADVLPDVDLALKTEVLDFIAEHKEYTSDVNFRTLMNLIMIRTDQSVKDWKKLALFALTEQ